MPSLLQHTIEQLRKVALNPQQEATMLLCHALGCTHADLFLQDESRIPQHAKLKLNALVARRRHHEPLAYLIGEADCLGITLKVTPHTLIPRPETESLILWVLAHYPNTPLRAADLGTGSGAIACAMAQARPDWHITASDTQAEALKVAQHNAEAHQLNNIQWKHTAWLDGYGTDYTLIIANPPYLAEHDPHLRDPDLQKEPRSALVAGPTGMEDLHSIIQQAPNHLLNGGCLVLEHGCAQGEAVRHCLQQHPYTGIATHADLAGHPRFTVAYLAPPTPST